MPARRRHRWVFAAAVVVLLVLHVDVWNQGRGDGLILGFIPYDLAYHLLWMLVAWAVVIYMTVFVWPDEQVDLADTTSPSSPTSESKEVGR